MDGRSWGIRIRTETTVRHTKCGRMRGMVVGEGGRSSGVLLYKANQYSEYCVSITNVYLFYID